MQTTNPLLDDLARLTGSALETLGGVKHELRGLAEQHRDRLIEELDLVRRDEFEIVKALAVAARQENEQLSARLTVLETKLGLTKLDLNHKTEQP